MDITTLTETIIEWCHQNGSTTLTENVGPLGAGLFAGSGDDINRGIRHHIDPNHPLGGASSSGGVDSIPEHPHANDPELEALYAGREYHGPLGDFFED